MKKFLVVSIVFLALTVAHGQTVSIKLFAEDNIGKKDSVVLGLNNASTLGTDSSFGEINIFGTPFDSLDIRVIQRDSANFNCIQKNYYQSPSTNLYFPNNIDSKIDFRPHGSFDSVFNNLEIFIYALNYPVTIRSDFSGIQSNPYSGWSAIHLLDQNCDAINTKSIFYDPWNDSLFALTNSSSNTLVVNFQFEIGIDEANSLNNFISFLPNPFSTQTTLQTVSQLNNATLTIYNCFGQIVAQIKNINGQAITFNRNNLPSGVYFVRLTEENKTIAVDKLVIIDK